MAGGPRTSYTKSGGVNIAYQVVGDGPFDLVFVPGWVSHLEYAWEEPAFARVLERLASFSRLILLDRRGTGLSDPVAALPTMEERMDDVRAVMDASGSERAALFGISEAGPMCLLFAATYPERTAAVVLYGSFARLLRDESYPHGIPREVLDRVLEGVEGMWGTGEMSKRFAPSIADDEARVASWARFERLAVSPGGAHTLMRIAADTDVRHLLPAVHVPTLVVHRTGDPITVVAGARLLAERIPGAKFVELPGGDHYPWFGDVDAVLDEVEEFLTGIRRGPEPDRVLATVLITDIVGSTERAAALGDSRWRELLERCYAAVRREVGRFRGREVQTTGDGLFAVFDGPARAVRCALAGDGAVATLGLAVRTGLHTGECELVGSDVRGLAVHIGARVAQQAGAGEVLVTSTVKDLVTGSLLRFADRGRHALRGIPGEWQLFAVERS